MIKVQTASFDKTDVQQNLKYYLKFIAYSFLIGSSVIALAKNYKKAMINEESFAAYKFFKEMRDLSGYENDTQQ